MHLDEMQTWLRSTIHDIKAERIPKMGRNEISPTKLSLINDCIKYMESVDRNNAFIGNHASICKTFKWIVKVVMHFIE